VVDESEDTVESIDELRGITELIFDGLEDAVVMVDVGESGGDRPVWASEEGSDGLRS
jgi:hypothetical protein